MITTLGDIFSYTNKLLDGNLDDISEVIDYMEEGQQLIALKYPIEAPVLNITLATNSFNKPADMAQLKKVVIDEKEVPIDDVWEDKIYLPKAYIEGIASIYYYKRPTALDSINPLQVPDIDKLYLPLIAKYAAKMYYLQDEDTEMINEYRNEFMIQLNDIGKINNNTRKSNYKNIW